MISPSAVPGGAERAFVSLARRLPALGVEVETVLLEDGGLREWLTEAGCRVEVIPTGRTRDPRSTARALRALRRRARAADVVISNQSKGHFLGGLAAALARRPAVYWQQGIPSRTPIEVAAAIVPASVIVCSSAPAVQAQRRLTPRREVRLIHLGIDVASVRAKRESGSTIRASLAAGGERLVGIVGRLQPWKGQDLFLRAAALVARDLDDVRFVVVGGALLGWEGDYPAELRRLADELGLADRVVFTGHQADVYPWYDALDIVVHASAEEPFGLVLVEAMALGKPLVAANEGGPREIVEHGESGLLASRTPDAMASAMIELLTDPLVRSRLERGARERAAAFDETVMAAGFRYLLEGVACAR